MARVLLTESIVGQPVDDLEQHFELVRDPDLWQHPEKLKETLPEFDALIVRNQTRVTGDLIAAGTRLKVIARAGAGLDNIDVSAAAAAGIPVVYAPEQNAISVAELAMGLMLGLARKIPAADQDTKKGGWDRHGFTGVELFGATLGVVGLGRIGFRLACRARAFGMRIIAHDEYVNPDGVAASELQAHMVGLDELLHQADFVSCHLPLTAETRGLFDYEGFCRMKQSAFFVNTSRGEVVDEDGLIRALQEGKIAGAALDVRQQEPPGESPLAGMDNVILTPHIAAFTHQGQHRVVACVCADVAAILRGASPKNAAL